MTFIEKTKRFIEPGLQSLSILLKALFVAIFWGINPIIHIIFFEKLTYSLLQKPELFNLTIGLYGIFIVGYEIINFSVKRWGWVEFEGNSWDFISQKYLTKFIIMDSNYVESIGTGRFISILTDGIRRWGFRLWQSIETGSKLLISILFSMYMISRINILYGFIFVGLFFCFFFLSRFINNKMFLQRKIRNENEIAITKNTVKVLMSKNELLQNKGIIGENSKIHELYEKDKQINKDMGTMRVFLTRNSGFGISILILVCYFFFGTSYIDGNMDFSVIVGISTALLMTQRTISDSLVFYIDFTKDFIKIEKLWEVFDIAPQMKGYDSGSPFSPKSQDIQIQNISYGYNETKVFSNFSLTIKRGQKTALVGASGGGKTTLMKLIAGYLHPQSGSISVLGNQLDETALKTYYPHIGYLTQDPSVFDATIRENLVSAIANKQTQTQTEDIMEDKNISGTKQKNTDVSVSSICVSLDENLHRALKLAHCDFVFDLEHGLDTEIGERGVRLSGGQKQRLAIAKIFLKDPEIILLDEPTSALDSFSEEAITVALDELFKNRTVIIVAHRLQTVRKADDIIVIEGGEIKERGTHADLVEQQGVYNRMLELQSGF